MLSRQPRQIAENHFELQFSGWMCDMFLSQRLRKHCQIFILIGVKVAHCTAVRNRRNVMIDEGCPTARKLEVARLVTCK